MAAARQSNTTSDRWLQGIAKPYCKMRLLPGKEFQLEDVIAMDDEEQHFTREVAQGQCHLPYQEREQEAVGSTKPPVESSAKVQRTGPMVRSLDIAFAVTNGNDREWIGAVRDRQPGEL